MKDNNGQGAGSGATEGVAGAAYEGKLPKEIFDMGIMNGDVKLVQQGLDAGADPSVFDNLAIQNAAQDGYLEVVDLLLKDNRVDPKANSNYAIHMAAIKGHLDVIKLLWRDNRIDPTAKDLFAIQWAADYGNIDIIEFLLEDGRADPTTWDNWAIRRASKYGRKDIVELLLNDKRVWTTLSQKLRKEFTTMIN